MRRLLLILAILALPSFAWASRGMVIVPRLSGTQSSPPAACVASQDTFTEDSTGDIYLSAGTPETGTWQGTYASNGTLLIDRGNDVLKSTSSASHYVTFSDAIAGSSVTIYANGSASATASRRVWVVGMYAADLDFTGYESRWDQAGKLDLRKSGVQVSSTTMATVLGSYTNTNYYGLKMVISDIGGAGQLIRIFVNDVEATVLRTYDTTFTSGYGGVGLSGEQSRITEAAIICP